MRSTSTRVAAAQGTDPVSPFSFEHEIGLVRQAITERAIDYPVAVDNDYAI